MFACAGFVSEQTVADQLVADITTLADGQCGFVRPETHSPVYAVLPFPVAGADVQALKAHLETALNSAFAAQDGAAEAA